MYFFYYLFFLYFFFIACRKGENVKVASNPSVIIIDQKALTCSSGIYGNIINGQSFQQDALFSIGDWQYTAYYNHERKLCIARRHVSQSVWEVLKLAGYKFSTLSTFDNDTHNTISLGYCINDGTIHVAFDTHSSHLNYSFSVKGLITYPKLHKWDSTLFSPVSNALQRGVPLLEFSYPSFIGTIDGDLLLGYRDGYSGVLHYKIAHYDGKISSWHDPKIFINGSGEYIDYISGLSTERCAYVNGLDINRRNGQLFISWTWREDIKGVTTANRDIYAAFSNDNGKNWISHKDREEGIWSGTNSPVFTNTVSLTVKNLDRGWGLMNQQAQTYDRNGNPHIIMYYRKERKPVPDFATIHDGQYVHYYLKDSTWIENRVPYIGNRPKFVFNKKNDLYLIYLDKDHFDYFTGSGRLVIVKAIASSDWTIWETIYESNRIYFSEPLIDRNRWDNSSILSIFIQETPISEGMSSELKLLEFVLP
jgi:hypothetical protein